MGLGRAEDPGGRGIYRPRRRLLYVLAGALLVFTLYRAVTSHGSATTAPIPALTRSCMQPAFAVSTQTVAPGAPFRVAITGSTTGRYVVYLDVAAVAYAGRQLVRTPVPGVSVGATQVVAEADGVPRCLGRQQVRLAADTAPGSHTLALFRVEPSFAETRLQTIPISVS